MAALLDHVGELVGQQPAALAARRRVAPLGEHHVMPDGIGMRRDRARRLGVRVDAHVREVVAELLLHLGTQTRLERAPGTRQHALDACRDRACVAASERRYALDAPWRDTSRCRARRPGRHLVGNAVGLALVYGSAGSGAAARV